MKYAIQTGLSGGSGVQNLSYTWDLAGNLKTRKDVNQSNLTEEFFYDNLYRLESSKLNGLTNLDMDYDSLGNITGKSDVGTYAYDATKKHQVVSTSNGWTFSYDNNGNMQTGRGSTMTWTSFNYPASIANGSNTSSFSYTPDRQYWKQVSNYASGGAATTIYVGGILEKVTTIAGTDFRHMIRAGGSTIIVSRQSTGTNSVHYVTSDHLGSSSAITNSSGGILVNSSFDAFGKRRGSNWTGSPSSGDWTAIAATTRRGYTEHSMLDNLSLIHMNGRVQDPVLGRFQSADPYIPEITTQGFNRYSYVSNNPLTFVDPSGFTPCFTVVINIRPPTGTATAPGHVDQDPDLPEVVVAGNRWQPTTTYCPGTPPSVPPPLRPPPINPTDSNPNPGDKPPDEPQEVEPSDHCKRLAAADTGEGVDPFTKNFGWGDLSSLDFHRDNLSRITSQNEAVDEFLDVAGLFAGGASVASPSRIGATLGLRSVGAISWVLAGYGYWSGKAAEHQRNAVRSIEARIAHLSAIQEGICKGSW